MGLWHPRLLSLWSCFCPQQECVPLATSSGPLVSEKRLQSSKQHLQTTASILKRETHAFFFVGFLFLFFVCFESSFSFLFFSFLFFSFLFFSFLIRYFLYLHFKCYPLSWFPLRKPPIPCPLPLLTNLPTPTSWPWPSSTLGLRTFTRPRASPPIDDCLGYILMQRKAILKTSLLTFSTPLPGDTFWPQHSVQLHHNRASLGAILCQGSSLEKPLPCFPHGSFVMDS
jgi:hypothetical protein